MKILELLEDLQRVRDTPYELDKQVIELYRWSYCYQMAQQEFSKTGLKRFENVARIFESNFDQLYDVVTSWLIPTFEFWLSTHNVDNPKQWARAIAEMHNKLYVREYDSIYGYFRDNDSFVHGGVIVGMTEIFPYLFSVDKVYSGYGVNGLLEMFGYYYVNKFVKKGINDVDSGDPNALSEFLEEKGLMDGFVDWCRKNERMLVEEMIDSLGREIIKDDWFINSCVGSEDKILDRLSTALYEKLYNKYVAVHPDIKLIYKKNKAILDKLVASSSTNDKIVNINIAINAVHKNGSMLDYVVEANEDIDNEGGAEHIENVLEGLSNGEYDDEFHETLDEVGIQY
jgi:hypothetical protein